MYGHFAAIPRNSSPLPFVADILSAHEHKSQQKAKKHVRLQRDANVLLGEVGKAHTQ